MDSGTSGGSMQSGSSCGEDDQSVANSFSAAAAASLTHRRHLLPHPQVYQQPIFSHQQQHHLHFPPPLTSNNNLFFDPLLPQSDLDRILSMPMNHPHPQQQQLHHQQQMVRSNDAARSTALEQKPPSKATPSGKENGPGSSGRVVKKRTRASRKTPTTVLTTDTANFRAMVQEFTGIPTPPFGPSPIFPAKKFDLFAPDNNPSLTSLLYSLNKATNPNPNPNPFAPPSNNAVNDPANFQQQTTQRADTMMTQGSNHGMFANPNLAAASFQSPAPFSSLSMYAARGSGGSGNEADHQLGGFSLDQNGQQRLKNTGAEKDK